jgi:hypothetical protein
MPPSPLPTTGVDVVGDIVSPICEPNAADHSFRPLTIHPDHTGKIPTPRRALPPGNDVGHDQRLIRAVESCPTAQAGREMSR